MTEFESQILYFFDKSPTRAQIRSLASMYGVKEENIIDILKQHGREIPEKKRGPKPKAKGTNADVVIIDEAAVPEPPDGVVTKMPDCVYKTIVKRMDELETDIKNYTDMVNRLEAEYAAHANYLMHCPFEQRNLSHSCSDDKVESPQPLG